MRQQNARTRIRACAVALILCATSTLAPAAAATLASSSAGGGTGQTQSSRRVATARSFTLRMAASRPGALLATVTPIGAASLESVATKASETGRNVAMSLIGLALAIAAIVLAFKRDFKQATAVFAVGLVCVLFASSAGESLLHETVNALVGA